MTELDTGVIGGQLPGHLPPIRVGRLLPGGQLSVDRIQVRDPPVQALPRQSRQLDLGDV